MSYATRKEAEMATQATSQGDPVTESTETVDQEATTPDEQATDETSGQATDQEQSRDEATTNSSDADTKKDPAKASLLADLHKERKGHKAMATKVAELEAKVTELSPVKDTLDAVQARYDRLEEFLQTAGGALGKALDSRTFTQALFESDDSIADIVKKWNAANPSATSTALGSAASAPASKGPDMNALLRSATK